METALRSAFLDVWSSHSLCKTGELHGLLYGCLGRRGMPAGIPGAGHEDTQRSLPVAPAVVVDYTPGRDSIEITRRLHCPAGVLEQLSRCRAPPLAMLAHCAAPDLRPALETSKDQVRLRPYQIRAAHV